MLQHVLPKGFRRARNYGFLQPNKKRLMFYDDKHSSDEDRFLLLGLSSGSRLLLVAHCERDAGHVIRIISARKATKRESAFYGK
ncbi:MAG: BrnT family toxin [Betaproteobacteria bacterium]|nr:BrnT family toxin [Betaproteobacteria bacterium]